MARTDLDIHAADPKASTPPGKSITACFDNLELQLGSLVSKLVFKSLELALAGLAIRITFSLTDVVFKKINVGSAITLSLLSLVKIPTPSLPSLSDIQAGFAKFFSLGCTTSANIVNKATEQTQTTRDPDAIANFQKRKASQVAANLSQQITDLQTSAQSIEGLRQEAARRAV